MKFFRKSTLIILGLLIMTGCEGLDKKLYERTPHIPVFAGIVKGKESESNPYWSRFTSINDSAEIRMDNGGTHVPDRPSMYGSLGTYYRMPKDYYLFMMTGGYGIQYDYFLNESTKISPAAYLGFAGTKGFSLSVSKKLGQFMDGDLVAYLAVQRQEIRVHLFCVPSDDSCSSGGLGGQNEVKAHQDIMNYFVGLEMGRFKIGTKANTTVLFRVELGMHNVLSDKITYERSAPTNYKPDSASPLISMAADFTLW